MGFNNWPFLTVHMWEESPIGNWTLEIVNHGERGIMQLLGRVTRNFGLLQNLS